MFEIIGYFAAILTTISLIPQVLKIFKSKNTATISLYMYICYVIGMICWLIYGIYLANLTMIISNSLVVALGLVILVYKLVNIFKNGEKP